MQVSTERVFQVREQPAQRRLISRFNHLNSSSSFIFPKMCQVLNIPYLTNLCRKARC